ncbi:MAG: ATP-dependent RNA helicase [Opitutae bacterium]|nr:ATP-dependent RNA helicase [Opitutae bacterium]
MVESSLPIECIRAPLLEGLKTLRRFVVTAPAGAGKSTQIPQILLDGMVDIDGTIMVLQPRRLAARMLAKRVAVERRQSLGDEVGFHVRFNQVTSPKTRILYVTEGLFWRRLISDPNLHGIGAILFDEFHERHIIGDLALARSLQIQQTDRPDLCIGVMSATLDISLVQEYLKPCSVHNCDGRSFPVQIEYSEDGCGSGARPVWEKVARHLPRILRENVEGDVLVFMPGAYEIRRTVESLQFLRETKDMDILSLHGEMSPEQQDRVLNNGVRRKVIIATNVAETSLTIEGVRQVIDSGLARISRYDSVRGIDTLLTERISQSSAEQRTGRAGRVGPGYCLRLWKSQEQTHMISHSEPEVLRVDLAPSILEMLASGISRLTDFPWLEPPDSKAITKAEKLLSALGALESGVLTPDGIRMSAFPLHPRYARLLLEGEKRGCLGLVCQMAAFVQGRNFLLPLKENRKEQARQELIHLHEMPGSDFFYLFKVFNLAAENEFSADFCREWGIHRVAAREAWQSSRQFLDLAKAQNMHFSDDDINLVDVRKCLLSAFPEQVARRLDRGTLRCALPGGRRGVLRRMSIADGSPLIVVAEIEEVVRQNAREMLLGLATEIEESWLKELFPGRFSDNTETLFDKNSRRVIVQRVRMFSDLVVEKRNHGEPDESRAAELLADAVISGNLRLKQWDESIEQWIERVNFFSQHYPEYCVSPIDESARRILLNEICLGALSYREIKNREVFPVLKSWLANGIETILETLAPPTLEIHGRQKPVPIRYSAGDASIALTVQELVSLPEHPVLGTGSYVLPIEVLAPNRRPVQITTNLRDFWQNSYPEIRKQLRGRYPKHNWPET